MGKEDDKPHGGQEEESPDLEHAEVEQVEARRPLTALVIHEIIRRAGKEELERAPEALAWSGLAAGMSMAFSLILSGLILSHLPHRDWAALLSRVGYTVGFLIVILGRQQLFTENTLTVILPLLHKWSAHNLLLVARLWGIVLATNLVGVLAVDVVIEWSPLFSRDVHEAFTAIGFMALKGGFWLTLLKGIFAGWLIALMVWLLPAAESARVWVIIIITYVVALGEFSHIIAGSSETMYLAVAGLISWGRYFGGYMAPTLIGNIIGGVALVAVLNHAQVVGGAERDEGKKGK